MFGALSSTPVIDSSMLEQTKEEATQLTKDAIWRLNRGLLCKRVQISRQVIRLSSKTFKEILPFKTTDCANYSCWLPLHMITTNSSISVRGDSLDVLQFWSNGIHRVNNTDSKKVAVVKSNFLKCMTTLSQSWVACMLSWNMSAITEPLEVSFKTPNWIVSCFCTPGLNPAPCSEWPQTTTWSQQPTVGKLPLGLVGHFSGHQWCITSWCKTQNPPFTEPNLVSSEVSWLVCLVFCVQQRRLSQCCESHIPQGCHPRENH